MSGADLVRQPVSAWHKAGFDTSEIMSFTQMSGADLVRQPVLAGIMQA